jgi:hypothetical protein
MVVLSLSPCAGLANSLSKGPSGLPSTVTTENSVILLHLISYIGKPHMGPRRGLLRAIPETLTLPGTIQGRFLLHAWSDDGTTIAFATTKYLYVYCMVCIGDGWKTFD